VMKQVKDLKAGDVTPWYVVLTDVGPMDGDPPVLGCRVRYSDGGEGERCWPVTAGHREVEVRP
jgi:hypothetical protein